MDSWCGFNVSPAIETSHCTETNGNSFPSICTVLRSIDLYRPVSPQMLKWRSAHSLTSRMRRLEALSLGFIPFYSIFDLLDMRLVFFSDLCGVFHDDLGPPEAKWWSYTIVNRWVNGDLWLTTRIGKIAGFQLGCKLKVWRRFVREKWVGSIPEKHCLPRFRMEHCLGVCSPPKRWIQTQQ